MRGCILLLCFVTVISAGCRNKNPNLSKTELLEELNREPEKPKVEEIPEGYIPPAGIKYTPSYDRSVPLIRLDMIGSLQNERPVKLSDFGKEVVYLRLGEFEYGVGSIISIKEEGYIAKTATGLWLLDKDLKKQRELLKEDVSIEKDGDFTMMYKPHAVIFDLYYDMPAGLFRCLILTENSADDFKREYSIGTIALDELLNSSTPLDMSAIKNRIKIGHASRIDPVKDGYCLTGWNIRGLYTFSLKGDTLCHFIPGNNDFTNPKGLGRNAEGDDYYTYNGEAAYRMAYTDTVFRVKGASTFQPAYKIDFGKYQVSRAEGVKPSFDLSEKYLVHNILETDDLLYIRFNQNYDCPNTRNSGSIKFHQAIYEKGSRQLYSFTDKNNISQPGLIPNDIDNGPGFWPQVELDGTLYMGKSGKDLKKELPKERLEQIPALQGLTDDEIVLITIK